MTGVAKPVVASPALQSPDALAFAGAGWALALAALALALWQRSRLAGAGRVVSEAAHELRGPLCAARLALGSLERALADSPGAGARLAAIDLELRRAGLAVDDLGAALRPTRPPDDREVTDVGELLTAAEPVWQAVARAHGAVLCVRPGAQPARVAASRLRLAQAIGNLVANACEHGGGLVTVGVSITGGGVRVEVCDQGPGLPAPVEQLCGRSGCRSSAPRDPASPRGHGLAVARRVAAEAGGRLEGAPAKCGARVVLELPAPSGDRAPLSRAS